MAKIVFTDDSTNKKVNVKFNDIAPISKIEELSLLKQNVSNLQLQLNDKGVDVVLNNKERYVFVFESIDTTAHPTITTNKLLFDYLDSIFIL